MGQTQSKEQEYLEILVAPIRVCAQYKPKMGHGRRQEFELSHFQELYRSDAFYCWFGLDNPLMYTAHKAAGGMTSIYRQIGIGCERLFRAILRDSLELTEEDVQWSYTIKKTKSKTRTLHLDARIDLDATRTSNARKRVEAWIQGAARRLGIDKRLARTLKGAVFEVRQGYKSKDSKRQNADIANAATAYTQAYLPCVAVMSAQIDDDIKERYVTEQWLVLTGRPAGATAHTCTYTFLNEVVGYDLAAFFVRNSGSLRNEVDIVLKRLLS